MSTEHRKVCAACGGGNSTMLDKRPVYYGDDGYAEHLCNKCLGSDNAIRVSGDQCCERCGAPNFMPPILQVTREQANALERLRIRYNWQYTPRGYYRYKDSPHYLPYQLMVVPDCAFESGTYIGVLTRSGFLGIELDGHTFRWSVAKSYRQRVDQ